MALALRDLVLYDQEELQLEETFDTRGNIMHDWGLLRDDASTWLSHSLQIVRYTAPHYRISSMLLFSRSAKAMPFISL